MTQDSANNYKGEICPLENGRFKYVITNDEKKVKIVSCSYTTEEESINELSRRLDAILNNKPFVANYSDPVVEKKKEAYEPIVVTKVKEFQNTHIH